MSQTKITGLMQKNEEIERLQKRIAELEHQLADCAEYLKEGETPAQCIERWRNDAQRMVRLLAELESKLKTAETAAQILGDDVYNLTEKVIPPIRQDAARYRAATNPEINTIEIRVWIGEENGSWEYPRSKFESDAAIDASMSEVDRPT